MFIELQFYTFLLTYLWALHVVFTIQMYADITHGNLW